ncbi:MAG: hypothetical protein FWD57_05410, partial [Polyangiaceae bacterium]|nr:hypothetical protein [Polyangiaceae bacterium]
GRSNGMVREEETLCAICAMRRMAAAANVPVSDAYRAIASDENGYAMLVMSFDQTRALIRGGKDLKQTATIGDCVHSELEKTFTKRARTHVKEILEAPASLGPARHLAVREALDNFVYTLPAILAEHGAFAVQADSKELVIVVRPSRAYSLAKELRAHHQEAFPLVHTESGKRLSLGPSAVATSSAVIALVPKDELPGALLSDCQAILQNVARKSLGGDAIVVLKRSKRETERLFAAHWFDTIHSLDAILRLVPSACSLTKLTRELVAIAPALSNLDLDKSSPHARLSLTQSVVDDSGLLDAEDDRLAFAKAVCVLIDQSVRLPGGFEEVHALDGLCIAAGLCGADQ